MVVDCGDVHPDLFVLLPEGEGRRRVKAKRQTVITDDKVEGRVEGGDWVSR